MAAHARPPFLTTTGRPSRLSSPGLVAAQWLVVISSILLSLGMLLAVPRSLLGNSPKSFYAIIPLLQTLFQTLHNEAHIPATTVANSRFLHRTWFNKTGNREMYMSCAAVTITNGGSGLGQSYPRIFVANIGTNQCRVPDGQVVDFPEPGADVKRSGSANKPVGTNCV
jgi:hypothetical protein